MKREGGDDVMKEGGGRKGTGNRTSALGGREAVARLVVRVVRRALQEELLVVPNLSLCDANMHAHLQTSGRDGEPGDHNYYSQWPSTHDYRTPSLLSHIKP